MTIKKLKSILNSLPESLDDHKAIITFADREGYFEVSDIKTHGTYDCFKEYYFHGNAQK